MYTHFRVVPYSGIQWVSLSSVFTDFYHSLNFLHSSHFLPRILILKLLNFQQFLNRDWIFTPGIFIKLILITILLVLKVKVGYLKDKAIPKLISTR